jgi:hypothetical protein
MAKTRRTLLVVFTLCFCMIISQSLTYAQETQKALLDRLTVEITTSTQLSDSIKDLVKSKLLLPFSVNPVLVAEIKAQNSKNVPLEKIQEIDNEWIAKEGEVPLRVELMANTTAKEINRLLKDIMQVAECFVMDNQGANVGQFNITSDYWQGDEEKWQNSFNGGKGGVDVGKKRIDESTGIAMQQVSLPIIDTDGTVVGTITFGIDLGK